MPKYFLAIIPPTSISNEIIAFQKEIEALFGAIHAQKAPPHITVIPPFNCEQEKLNSFIIELNSFLVKPDYDDITIDLDNFQRFENRTLFVDVAKNEPLEKFCKAIKLLFNEQKIINQRVEKHYFIPHITIANKDIKKRDFKQAWEIFKERKYQQSFNLESIAVLELVENNWRVLRVLPF